MLKTGFGQGKEFVQEQYKSTSNLAVRRRTHELYEEKPINFIAWNLDKLNWMGDERVLDVGCGDGAYSAPAQKRAGSYIAGDFSYGMLTSLQGRANQRVNLDAQYLPFPDQSMDVILANHMLYHVPDQQQAITEFKRLLRPGGQLLAATNSSNNMPELKTLQMQVMDLIGIDSSQIQWPRTVLSFTLENGAALLGDHFTNVKRYDLPGALLFTEPQPLIAYLSSMREGYLALMPAGISWKMVTDGLDAVLSRHIAEHGQFRVSKLAGTFVCS